MSLLFKFVPKDRYFTECTVLIPGDNNNVAEKFKFKLEVKRFDQPTVKAMLAGDPTVLDIDLDADEIGAVVRKTVLGWSDLPGADGGSVPFTPENLDEALKIVCYRQAFWQVFLDQLKKPEEPGRKNAKN